MAAPTTPAPMMITSKIGDCGSPVADLDEDAVILSPQSAFRNPRSAVQSWFEIHGCLGGASPGLQLGLRSIATHARCVGRCRHPATHGFYGAARVIGTQARQGGDAQCCGVCRRVDVNRCL